MRAQVVVEQAEVADLGRRHRGQGRPARQRRRLPGVLGEPVEGRELAVREHAEQVHRGAVGRVTGPPEGCSTPASRDGEAGGGAVVMAPSLMRSTWNKAPAVPGSDHRWCFERAPGTP